MTEIHTTSIEFYANGQRVGIMHVRLLPHDVELEWFEEVCRVAEHLTEIHQADIRVENYGDHVVTVRSIA